MQLSAEQGRAQPILTARGVVKTYRTGMNEVPRCAASIWTSGPASSS